MRPAQVHFHRRATDGFLYLPYRQNTAQRMMLVAQSTGDAAALAAPLRDVVHGLDANMPLSTCARLEQLYQMRAIRHLQCPRHDGRGDGADGACALNRRVVRLVAYSATRRTREIGIRMRLAPRRRRCFAWCSVRVSARVDRLIVGLGAASAPASCERGVFRAATINAISWRS